ncbi:hypothetical protein B5K08_30210 [Rhizobium leguminosarum bv. trifolii]|uniref:Lipoprotein n=1 Tax=Rhizobium leguminosarum bv. trifolii TaxID=386 RepID=A0A3E1B087_RHILT|nr:MULTISPECIES: hypothetical protein [Rhizobium]ANM14955.1 hypothetical protein AMK05_PE00587 [Rhizobium sp. N324]ANM21343.1 hypothetical protein AMK06_PE00583 [Rhizobium sp. N541]ANM27715.1 hypothetical protein AMK07_PE00584 [Rhizobium sp. N941]OYD00059.1 hypothetical protein AMK08_PE00585 [Rhizobium sp. N4311]RFB83274.1 hypothetical protein B5K10_30205 [Rhizobium leguminosarum bv. trifolii]
MLQIRKTLAAVAAIIVVAVSSSCTTGSTDSVQTGSVGYSSVDYGLRPACRDGFGNDRPCSY